MPRRVVVTGLGIISPVGIGRDAFGKALADGTSGIGPIELMAYSGLPRHIAAEVVEFTDATAKKIYPRPQRKSVKVMCREIQLGVASAILALEDAGVDLEAIDHNRLGVDFGANQMFSHPEALFGGARLCAEGPEHEFNYEKWGGTGMGGLEPLWLLKYLPNMPACHIGIAADARGPNNSLTLAEASGNLAIGEATRVISRGSADLMIAGSAGARLHPVHCIHSLMWDELADSDDDPTTWPRPFDRRRIGQVVGEAACSLLLEDESHARGRGAEILGTVLGLGSSCVRDRQGTANPQAALVHAIRRALDDADLEPASVGHINAHGLATQQADIDEAAAIREVFGELAERVPVTALKSSLGNSGAGCGSLELAGSLLGLANGVIPHTLNFTEPDPDCLLDIVHGAPRPVDNKVVINLNLTAMGQASALVVEGA